MKIRVKHILILMLVIILFFIVLFKVINSNKGVAQESNKDLKTGTSISMMLETKYQSGEYKLSNDKKWPGDGYAFNESLSYCENGTAISWNNETKSVSLKTRLSDKFYVYFDVEQLDATITVNNLPTSLNGKLGSISCENNTSTYNQMYNRVEISNLSKAYDKCTLNFTNSFTKSYLNTYITGLSGTTQGTGQVVNETDVVPDYANATSLSESEYVNPNIFSSTSNNSTSETTVTGAFSFSNDKWTNVPSALTSGEYYHFQFKPQESGYYKLCVNLSNLGGMII